MVDYQGRFTFFDTRRIRTYDLESRPSKVTEADIANPDEDAPDGPRYESPELTQIVRAITQARRDGRPVILLSGAHLIKNGFGPLILDLVRRDLLTLVAMNAAGMIHDLELALIGRTSEDVPDSLPRGRFGFAEQTGRLINRALRHGDRLEVGAGESLARLILGEPFPERVEFPFRGLSLLAGGFERGVPVTMHASIGTDIIDQVPDWDPAAKGACSGRDFLIFCAEVERMTAGGVYLNIGSAVTGPEVFLKACSMCANVGSPPRGIVTGVFDFRPARVEDVDDERKPGYYYRDVKSVVVRIPQAFGGQGYYVQGDHLRTVPALHRALIGA